MSQAFGEQALTRSPSSCFPLASQLGAYARRQFRDFLALLAASAEHKRRTATVYFQIDDAGQANEEVQVAWLLREGEVLASLDVKTPPQGLFCSVACDDAANATVFLASVRVVHTIGATSRIDVAFLDGEHVVTDLSLMAPFRLNIARRTTRAVLSAPAGSFERWSLWLRGSTRGAIVSNETNMAIAGGLLVLVGTPIGNLEDFSPRAVAALLSADVICCEDTRHTGKLLKHFAIEPKRLLSLHEHNESARCAELMELFRQNMTIAVVSDAGMPLVSDPGERLVRLAIENNVAVTVVPGPFAGVTALVISGLAFERWRFEGFLPRRGSERAARLAEIASAQYPSVIYESPHRVRATLSDLALVCGALREVAIARELTKLFEEVIRLPLSEAVDCDAVVSPRGEFVLIVAGAESAKHGDDLAIEGAIARLIDAGLHAHDAVKAVEVLLGVPHRQAYQASLSIKAALADAPAPANGEVLEQ